MEEIEIYVGCGNVFEDLGLPNAEELHLQSHLAIEIRLAIKAKRLTRQQAARKLGISKEEMEDILDKSPFDHSVGQLVQYLNRLDRDVKLFASVTERKQAATKRAQKKEREEAYASAT